MKVMSIFRHSLEYRILECAIITLVQTEAQAKNGNASVTDGTRRGEIRKIQKSNFRGHPIFKCGAGIDGVVLLTCQERGGAGIF
jgi:hypothetical protein